MGLDAGLLFDAEVESILRLSGEAGSKRVD
jgi:hypothetical protein